MATIRTARLTKDFGDLRAVNEINLDLPEGRWLDSSVRTVPASPPPSGTFEIPAAIERHNLSVGDGAKLGFADAATAGVERMWVVVSEVETPGRYVGILRSHPFEIEVDTSEPIRFEARHVMSIHASD